MQEGKDLSEEVGIDAIERSVLDAIARDEAVDAFALLFLLRRFRATGRDELNDALGLALGGAIAGHLSASSALDRAAWLQLFIEAMFVSDDDRLREAARALLDALRAEWTGAAVDLAATSFDAWFHAVDLPEARAGVAEAVDGLERLVACSYSPGRGMRGGFADQIRTASALLSAYELSGRLPYSMLAEELLQTALRVECGDFVLTCEAARVCSRLAALHADAAYRAAAVIARDADYRSEAERLLASQSEEARRRGAAAGIYALAALELELSKSEV